jgi:hypothetical protein
MNQLDMFPTISLGQLDELLHFQEIAVDTATRATINAPATLQYATSIARAKLQSATRTAISERSRSDAHHWPSYELRTLYECAMGWAMLSGRCDVVYAVDTTSSCAKVCKTYSGAAVRIYYNFEKQASIYRKATDYRLSLDTSPAQRSLRLFIARMLLWVFVGGGASHR